jgi:site-specific DNA-methyltransferase (adenine-specific)
VWREKIERSKKRHVHEKPLGLQTALIEATSNKGDIIVDPCAGSFSVMDAAHACGRKFLGCDILG